MPDTLKSDTFGHCRAWYCPILAGHYRTLTGQSIGQSDSYRTPSPDSRPDSHRTVTGHDRFDPMTGQSDIQGSERPWVQSWPGGGSRRPWPACGRRASFLNIHVPYTHTTSLRWSSTAVDSTGTPRGTVLRGTEHHRASSIRAGVHRPLMAAGAAVAHPRAADAQASVRLRRDSFWRPPISIHHHPLLFWILRLR